MASHYHFDIFKHFVYVCCNADLHSSLAYQDQVWYQQNVYIKSVSRDTIIICNYEEVYKESLTRYFHDDPGHISRYMLPIISLATIRLLIE
jgi:hypothetical protein